MSAKRIIDVLRHIIIYCHDIELFRQRFGDTFEALKDDIAYKSAAAMNVLQIGELATLLPKVFKLAPGHIP
jgi:uncharacterized protein with HEPN domain